ncbi:MlaD family protein [Actinomycetospora endophytica]|uniref:MlaD family protein n=1 Tax=Actinomycetospora endophytica TaxID=2291215 RepID=A0ABS8PIY0_9PSEU|nr:MlaD family protein [Actinomycetospora endophytica]MCD2198241.1 MlaD family protein [Actinomycetospora endophytica]
MTKQFTLRVVVLALFFLGCVAFAVFFWFRAGADIPGVTVGHYTVDMSTKDVQGLVANSEVRIAGVTVGRVTALDADGPDDQAHVEMTLDGGAVPLHQGMTARIGMKSLIGATFVDIVDGHGAPLSSGYQLPAGQVLPAVSIENVVRGLDPKTRQALSGTVRSLGAATAGRGPDVSQLAEGLGRLGAGGHTALDAIAAQSDDLTKLTGETTDLLNALDTSNGQIVDVVDNARAIVGATAGQRPALEQTMQQLPGVLSSAQSATGKLTELAGPLTPVAADLKAAAPDLNQALVQLPDTSRDLRGLLPDLKGILDRAPATLDRVPDLADDVDALVPPTHELLRDANPALAYAAPYGRDTGAMLASFASSMQTNSENGVNAVRLAPVINTQSVRNVPVKTAGLDPTNWNNPFAVPGKAGQQAPFSGPYPRLERAPG